MSGGFTAMATLAAFLDEFAAAVAEDEDYIDRLQEENPWEAPSTLADGAIGVVWKFAKEQGLQRIPGDIDDEVLFDPNLHQCAEGTPAVGALVKVLEPGWTWQVPEGRRARHTDGRRGWRWQAAFEVIRKSTVKDPTAERAAQRAAAAERHNAYFLGPQRIGGRYYNGYWHQEYTVLDIHYDANGKARQITIRDEEGTRTHQTPWGFSGAHLVIEQPT
ncbi:hypothetical protein [Nonomuraea sp. NPDC049784]|uniref:hypothetical protein n=1 Tax=Nonomuraea sp. NPDC049784 TaxID=3154361 RepID=UPI0033C1C0B8